MNFLPQRMGRKYFIYTMTTNTRSIVEYRVSAAQRVQDGFIYNGGSFPTGHCDRTAPIAKALIFVLSKLVWVRKKGLLQVIKERIAMLRS